VGQVEAALWPWCQRHVECSGNRLINVGRADLAKKSYKLAGLAGLCCG
jgi:hypothetical protein